MEAIWKQKAHEACRNLLLSDIPCSYPPPSARHTMSSESSNRHPITDSHLLADLLALHLLFRKADHPPSASSTLPQRAPPSAYPPRPCLCPQHRSRSARSSLSSPTSTLSREQKLYCAPAGGRWITRLLRSTRSKSGRCKVGKRWLLFRLFLVAKADSCRNVDFFNVKGDRSGCDQDGEG